MAAEWELVGVTKDKQSIGEALKEHKFVEKDGDVHMYALEKTEKVSAKKIVALLDEGKKNASFGEEARSKLGLPKGADGQLKPASVPKGFTAFVQSTSHNRKMPKGGQIIVLRQGAGDSKKRKADPKSAAKGPIKKPKTGDAKDRINKLLADFKANGTCKAPVAEKDLPLKGDLPEELKSMLLASGEWLLKKTVDDFPTEMLTIFQGGKFMDDGDDYTWPPDFKEEFLKENPKPNIAEEGWKVFAMVCDYTELCVNTKTGAVRWLKVEDCEDGPVTEGPFTNFFHLLEDYTHFLIAQDCSDADAVDILDFAEEHAKH